MSALPCNLVSTFACHSSRIHAAVSRGGPGVLWEERKQRRARLCADHCRRQYYLRVHMRPPPRDNRFAPYAHALTPPAFRGSIPVQASTRTIPATVLDAVQILSRRLPFLLRIAMTTCGGRLSLQCTHSSSSRLIVCDSSIRRYRRYGRRPGAVVGRLQDMFQVPPYTYEEQLSVQAHYRRRLLRRRYGRRGQTAQVKAQYDSLRQSPQVQCVAYRREPRCEYIFPAVSCHWVPSLPLVVSDKYA